MIHMRKSHILICLLAALMMLFITVASADTGTVTASYLYLREKPTSDSEALTKIRLGTKLDILSQSGHWYKVSYGGYEGYVYDAYIILSDDDDLEKGDSGDLVKELQERLKELGYYSSSCDGDFGLVTEKAVKAFQAKNGLDETGIVDEKTQKKLDSSSAIKADGKKASSSSSSSSSTSSSSKDDGILEKGDKGDAVKELQKRLKELGYYTNTADGDYGTVTVNAVKAFQKNNGLTQDGVAGTTTQKKLYSSSAIAANGKTEVKEEDKVEDTSTLQKGDKGDAVKKLQKRLKELGYYAPSVADGDYGNVTVDAVKAFQKRNGLTQDGVAGPTTQKKLYSDSAIAAKDEADDKKDEEVSDGTLSKGAKGDAVKKLQKRLKELGYYTPSVADGDYGNVTVDAVKAFQKRNGLTQDGVAGPTTQAKLYSDSAIAAKDEADDKKDEEVSDGTLRKGDKGDAVKKLQKRLKELGYYTPSVADGDYGSVTVDAVKVFQKKNGLTDDGVAGPTTQAKLYSDSAIGAKDKTDDKEDNKEDEDTSTLQKGDKGDAVKKLQKRLKELGYYTPTVADGDYGNKTVDAVKAFQKKNGLTDDGVAGPSTQAKLYSDSAIGANDKTNDKEEDKEEEDTSTLKKGDKGDAVKKLQERLKELGYYKNVIDSSYGDRTVDAIKAFQKNNNLTVDGVAGPTTQTKLYSSSAKGANESSNATLVTNQTLKKGDSGAQVKALQNRLKELGYYTTTVDSDYGYRTAEAVSAFQRANGLNVSGTADSATLKKLVSSSAISKEDADKAEKEEEEKYITERLDWFKDGAETFPRKAIIKIKDCKTGLVFNAKVLYGSNHLDVEPLTAADTAILLKINGGVEFSYRRRPMLVQYDGHVYASSIYSEPHGDQTITDNNFEGQFCLHFYGSKLHKKNEDGVAVVDADHQSCVAEAMKYTW